MIKVKISIAFITKCCKVNFVVLLAFMLGHAKAHNNPALLTKTYISWYAENAVDQMIQYGIPASVTLAQAIFESRSGNSLLAKKSNNHFGIKCQGVWGGDTVVKTDDTLNECFRKYSSVEESYIDHSLFLTTRPRYAHLFNIPITDYKAWCIGLKNAGYATYPSYAEELIKIIEENKLYRLDVCEKVNTKNLAGSDKKVIKSKLKTEHFSVKDFARSGLLFINEKNISMQVVHILVKYYELPNTLVKK